MEKLELAAVLNRAADYLDSHGLRSGSWGAPGGPVCMNSALAIALDRDPAALGTMWFFARGTNPTTSEVGRVILESGLLEQLPVPQGAPGERRRSRPTRIDVRAAVLELAAWSDVPGRTAGFAAAALRAQAVALVRAALPRAAQIDAPLANALDLVLA
jgi:hypothetical protein